MRFSHFTPVRLCRCGGKCNKHNQSGHKPRHHDPSKFMQYSNSGGGSPVNLLAGSGYANNASHTQTSTSYFTDSAADTTTILGTTKEDRGVKPEPLDRDDEAIDEEEEAYEEGRQQLSAEEYEHLSQLGLTMDERKNVLARHLKCQKTHFNVVTRLYEFYEVTCPQGSVCMTEYTIANEADLLAGTLPYNLGCGTCNSTTNEADCMRPSANDTTWKCCCQFENCNGARDLKPFINYVTSYERDSCLEFTIEKTDLKHMQLVKCPRKDGLQCHFAVKHLKDSSGVEKAIGFCDKAAPGCEQEGICFTNFTDLNVLKRHYHNVYSFFGVLTDFLDGEDVLGEQIDEVYGRFMGDPKHVHKYGIVTLVFLLAMTFVAYSLHRPHYDTVPREVSAELSQFLVKPGCPKSCQSGDDLRMAGSLTKAM